MTDVLSNVKGKITDRRPACWKILDRIKEMMQSGALQAGDRMPSEDEFAEAFGVSRGTVREAMKILSAYGIVEIRRGDGTYVASEPSSLAFEPLLFSFLLMRPDLTSLIGFREAIESEVLEMILKRGDDAVLEPVRTALEHMREKARAEQCPVEDYTDLDLEYHRALAAACGNPLMERMYTFLLEFFKPFIQTTYREERNIQSALRLHEEILDALATGDPARCRETVTHSLDVWHQLNEKWRG